jgi:hypothetical protein
MSNVKILVCAHKQDYVKSDDIYMPIQGGKAISNVDLGFQGDDTGDNISEKNPYYCELTVLYWAWKNLKDIDYIGLCHYRRYFKFSNYSFRQLEFSSVENFLNMKDTTFDLDKHLGKYDIIIAKPNIYPYSLRHDYAHCHRSEDYFLLKETIYTIFPDYYDSFCKVMENNNLLSPYSMFITKWNIFDDYCKWLFAILENIEKQRDLKTYLTYQMRVLGFMAERLLNVYVSKNKLKVKYYPIIILDDKNEKCSLFISIIFNLKFRLSFLFNRS